MKQSYSWTGRRSEAAHSCHDGKIADAVLADGLASREEIEQLISDLYDYARTPGTIGATPRIVEAWGRVQPRKECEVAIRGVVGRKTADA